MHTWIKVEGWLPDDNVWVLGLCEVGLPEHRQKVVFQVKYQKEVGWSDWCGDREDDSSWKVTHWMSIPSTIDFHT